MADTKIIRDIIKRAVEHEKTTGNLQKVIESGMHTLHHSICLPKNRPNQALLDFAIRYIEHVPNFVDAISGLTRQAGIYSYAGIFLDIAANYFIDPPDLIAEHTGLHALMDEAYLAHRLFEELNDRVVARCNIPLVPMDMTRANLIAYELIGEPFANELDFAVHYAIEMHTSKEDLMDNDEFRLFVKQHKDVGWLAELDQWPCLAEDLDINFKF